MLPLKANRKLFMGRPLTSRLTLMTLIGQSKGHCDLQTLISCQGFNQAHAICLLRTYLLVYTC